MPAILIEVGFITNEGDREFMTSSAGKEAITYAIYRGFYDWWHGNS